MTRHITRYVGLLIFSVGVLLTAAPVLAYQDTSPGSGASVSSSTSSPGGSVTVTATFTDLPAGTTITWSASGCTVTFASSTQTLDANHSASTTATFGSNCAGVNATLTATGPQGQTVSAAVAVGGGFPNTSTAPVPVGWIVMGFGALLILAGLFSVAWRRRPATPASA